MREAAGGGVSMLSITLENACKQRRHHARIRNEFPRGHRGRVRYKLPQGELFRRFRGSLPPVYAPFNIIPVAGNGAMRLFVTCAVQDADAKDDVSGQGHGMVNTFDLEHALFHRRTERRRGRFVRQPAPAIKVTGKLAPRSCRSRGAWYPIRSLLFSA